MIADLIQDISDVRDLRQQRTSDLPRLSETRAFDGTTPFGMLRRRDPETGTITIYPAHDFRISAPKRITYKRDRGLAGLIRQLRGRN